MSSTNQHVAPDVGCKKCKTVVKSGLKCLNCGVLSHVCCLKHLKNIIYIDESTVKCCESINSEVNIDDLDVSFGSAKDFDISDSFKREFYYLKLIIKQKDLVIDNQQITIRSFSEQIDLLKQNNNHLNKHQARPESSRGDNYQRADKPIQTGFTHSARSPAIDAENPGVSGRGNAYQTDHLMIRE
ncbi:hypothetical protein JTB14_004956 [Gonioctena quinquepunctata]|nr:hypothetical protein JTB14_004956 [Gonioctena quinquepunctata]